MESAKLLPGSSPRRELAATIFKNSVAVTLGSMGLKGLNFAFGVYVVRQLGDGGFGQYTTVMAFVSLFQIFAELGMSQYVMREIARDRSRTQDLLWNLVALRFILAIAGVVGISWLARGLGYSEAIVAAVFLYTWTFVFAAVESPLTTVLTANERLDIATFLTVVGQLGYMVLGYWVLSSGGGFTALIAAGLAAMVPRVLFALLVVLRLRLIQLAPRFEPRRWRHLVQAGLPFGLVSLALTIAFSIDSVMLSWFHPAEEVGWYNAGYGLVRSLMILFGGFSGAIVPSLSRIYLDDAATVKRWYHRSVKVILILSLPIAVGGTLVADPLMRYLYTDSFAPAVRGLQILIWDVPLLMFTSFCGNMTTIVGEERAAARVYGINAAANVGLNLVAIPVYGLVGAAVVTVVTDLIGALQFHLLLRHRLQLPDMTGILVRILVAAVLMGAVVKALGNLQVFLLIGLGIPVYLLLIYLLRIVGGEEWALVRRMVPALDRFVAPATPGD